MARLSSPLRCCLALLLGACQDQPTQVSESSMTQGSSTSEPIPPEPGSSTGAESTGLDTTPNTSGDTSTGPATVDTTGDGPGTTSTATDSSSGEDSSTGEPSTIGCADGLRDALIDPTTYPNIAACAGGFGVPGVTQGAPLCDRMGGDDGPIPDGMGCSVEDLCAEGWHLCTSRQEVVAAGLDDCETPSWDTQLFITAQSGEGANTCDPTGANDVFGCGDVGHTNITGCDPLNRSTGNLCENVAGPWDCGNDPYNEATSLSKPGSSHGGALCCLDGI